MINAIAPSLVLSSSAPDPDDGLINVAVAFSGVAASTSATSAWATGAPAARGGQQEPLHLRGRARPNGPVTVDVEPTTVTRATPASSIQLSRTPTPPRIVTLASSSASPPTAARSASRPRSPRRSTTSPTPMLSDQRQRGQLRRLGQGEQLDLVPTALRMTSSFPQRGPRRGHQRQRGLEHSHLDLRRHAAFGLDHLRLDGGLFNAASWANAIVLAPRSTPAAPDSRWSGAASERPASIGTG